MASSTHDVSSPCVVSLAFTDQDSRLSVELDDGRCISVPLEWFPRLRHGGTAERNHWRIVGAGGGIHWPDLDEDISVDNLLSGKRSQESQDSLARWLAERPAKPDRN